MTAGSFDGWTVEQDGVTYAVELVYDDDSNAGDITKDDEGLSPSDVAAHQAGDWYYIGVLVTPEVDGQRITAAGASLWGTQYGTLPAESAPWQGGQHDRIDIGRDEITRYPVADLIGEARSNLARLYGQLAGLSLDGCPAYNPGEARVPGHVVANAHCTRAAGHEMPHRDLDGREWS